MPARIHGDLVVVVGDDLPIRRWLTRLFGRQGYRVTDAQGPSTLTDLDRRGMQSAAAIAFAKPE
jgi:CheY-like chemotaxis protein